jgi:hypothetical protein
VHLTHEVLGLRECRGASEQSDGICRRLEVSAAGPDPFRHKEMRELDGVRCTGKTRKLGRD